MASRFDPPPSVTTPSTQQAITTVSVQGSMYAAGGLARYEVEVFGDPAQVLPGDPLTGQRWQGARPSARGVTPTPGAGGVAAAFKGMGAALAQKYVGFVAGSVFSRAVAAQFGQPWSGIGLTLGGAVGLYGLSESEAEGISYDLIQGALFGFVFAGATQLAKFGEEVYEAVIEAIEQSGGYVLEATVFPPQYQAGPFGAGSGVVNPHPFPGPDMPYDITPPHLQF